MKPNRIRMPRRTPLVIRGCSILRPFGQQLSHFYFFSKLRLSNPKFKNIINFSSAAKKFEENLRNKGFYNTKKNAKHNDEEKNC